MKKISIFVALVAAITLSSCGYDDSGINNRLDELDNRLEKLEGTTLPSINEQIESINASIADLKVVDTELHNLIDTIEADAEEHSELIATLQTKASALESKIATLEEYVDSEITATEDWAAATFATLEQYAEVQSEISGLKTLIEQNKSDITEAYTTAISEAITTSEGSMKEWVNEQLAGYYTIAETDAKLELLQRSIDTLSESLAEEVKTLSGRIDTMKSELTKSYKVAITEAIETNNGVINAKIAEEINSVNSRIDEEVTSINARIDALEGRIKDLEDALDKIKALDIVFDIESGKACMAGLSIEFGYTIVGGDEETEVESFGDGGWRADVTPTDATSGRVRVTAPKDGGNGKVIVLATSGAGASTMKSIRFDEGVLTNILDSYEVGWETCTLEVRLRTNLDYEVRIPAEAQSWLSVADTRAALREDTLTFTIAENPEDEPARSATIELVNEVGETLQSFEIVQNIQNNKYGAYYIKSVTSTAVTVSTTPEAFVVEYYVWVDSQAKVDYYIQAGGGESILNSLIKNSLSGSWHLTAANEGVWGGLTPETDYLCMILTVDNRGAEVLSKIEFRTSDKQLGEPQGEVSVTPASENPHKTLNVNIFSEDAAYVKVAFNTAADIQEQRNDDRTDSDIARLYGFELNAEQVEAVRTTGFSIIHEELWPDTEYIAVVSIKNAEQTETIICASGNTPKKALPARVESDLFETLQGEWLVSYDLVQVNGMNVSITDAKVTIAAGADDKSTKEYRDYNRLVVLGWPFDVTSQGVLKEVPYYSPADLLDSSSYWRNYESLAYRDYGPKIFLEIGEGDTITIPSERNHYLYNWASDGYVLYFYGADYNAKQSAPATFPVTVSEDGNTLTIGAHHSGAEFSYGVYRPSVFRDNEMLAVATSDIVLKRVK